MAKQRVQVMVDSWGDRPEYKRGAVIEIDPDDTEHPFPYDVPYALANGTLRDLDAVDPDAPAPEAEAAPAPDSSTTSTSSSTGGTTSTKR